MGVAVAQTGRIPTEVITDGGRYLATYWPLISHPPKKLAKIVYKLQKPITSKKLLTTQEYSLS